MQSCQEDECLRVSSGNDVPEVPQPQEELSDGEVSVQKRGWEMRGEKKHD